MRLSCKVARTKADLAKGIATEDGCDLSVTNESEICVRTNKICDPKQVPPNRSGFSAVSDVVAHNGSGQRHDPPLQIQVLPISVSGFQARVRSGGLPEAMCRNPGLGYSLMPIRNAGSTAMPFRKTTCDRQVKRSDCKKWAGTAFGTPIGR